MTELDNLVVEHQNYIYGLTKYFENYSSKEDLFQAGAIGLINAYKKFDSRNYYNGYYCPCNF